MAEHNVYRIVHRESGKFYIGISARPVAARWREHKRARGKSYMARAIRKYGPNAFSIEQIAYAEDLAEARELERHLIAKLQPEYNLTDGGEGTWGLVRGTMPQATRDKIAAALTGRKLPPEHRAKLFGRPAHMKGKRHSEETKAKISASRTGIKIPAQAAERRNRAVHAYLNSPEGRADQARRAAKRWRPCP